MCILEIMFNLPLKKKSSLRQIMDQQIREAKIKQLNNKYEEQNIFTRVLKYKQSYKQAKILMEQILSNQEQRQKIFIGKKVERIHSYIYIGNYDRSAWNQQIIRGLNKIKQFRQNIVIWNSNCIEDLENYLIQKTKLFMIQSLQFYGCDIGNRIYKIISYSSHHIIRLSFSSDPIGNKGLQKLAQLNLRFLTQFQLDNTNCTTDCLKNLRKIKSKVRQIKIQRHFRLNSLELLTFACSLFATAHPQLFMKPHEDDKQHYVFINNISKRLFFQLSITAVSKICLFDRKIQTKAAWKKQMLIPKKVCDILQNMNGGFTIMIID